MTTQLGKEICRILDFNPDFYLDLALKEAINREKLVSTWMFVNGELYWLSGVDVSANLAYVSRYNTGGKVIPVERLDVWTPESGVYETEQGIFYIKKRPVKQWKKSFNLNHYFMYTVESKGSPIGKYEEYLPEIAKVKPRVFTISKNLKLFMYNKKIGTVNKHSNTLTLEKKSLIPEVEEYLKAEGLTWNLN